MKVKFSELEIGDLFYTFRGKNKVVAMKTTETNNQYGYTMTNIVYISGPTGYTSSKSDWMIVEKCEQSLQKPIEFGD